MPDPLFAKSKSNKRKRSQPSVTRPNTKGGSRTKPPAPAPGKKRRPNGDDDEELSSEKDEMVGIFDDVDLEGPAAQFEAGSGDEFEDETPAEKRLRLAKLYLNSMKKGLGRGGDDEEGEEVAGWDAEEVDREIIESRLQRDVLEHSGRVHSFIADQIATNLTDARYLRLRGNKLPVTQAVMSEDGRTLFSASKDGAIVKWDLTSGQRVATLWKHRAPKGKGKQKETTFEGHTDEVLTLALSSDGKYLASGGKDRRVAIWDPAEVKLIKSFGGHKDLISGLAFRKASHQLFSASYDRTIKIFDLSPQVMGYIETLFGHQDVINSIDALRSETALSSGSRDRTVRFWKVVEENQLVFRGGGKSALRDVLEGVPVDEAEADGAEARPKGKEKEANNYREGSMECVAMIDESTFLSGGDSGAIRLWSLTKKKAVYTHGLAHGLHETISNTEGVLLSPRWITSIAALRFSNVFASGSWDGFIRLWKLDDKNKSFAPLTSIPAPGFVNSLQIISPPPGALDKASWILQPPPPTAADPLPAIVVDQQPSEESTLAPPRSKLKQQCVIVAGLGQEPRLGRWLRIAGEGTGSRNGVLVVAIPFSDELSKSINHS